jgi:hypothetical protein
MTVAELIAKLQELPQDARVFTDSPHMDEATIVRQVVIPIRRPGHYYGGQELLIVVQ